MGMAQVPGPSSVDGEESRVRDLLRRYGVSSDAVERSELLARLADALDHAARDIVAAQPETYPRELVGGLRGQAAMARLIATVEHRSGDRPAC